MARLPPPSPANLQLPICNCQFAIPNRPRTFSVSSRQRIRRVNLRLFRRIVSALLQETWPQGVCHLAIYLVAEPEMTRLNETFLRHKGSTDVITFDYAPQPVRNAECGMRSSGFRTPHSALPTPHSEVLHGEIFVCLDEAVSQARLFHTTWQSELVRYVVHGILHLLGYNDTDRRGRRNMKTAEDALVRRLARQFVLPGLAGKA